MKTPDVAFCGRQLDLSMNYVEEKTLVLTLVVVVVGLRK